MKQNDRRSPNNFYKMLLRGLFFNLSIFSDLGGLFVMKNKEDVLIDALKYISGGVANYQWWARKALKEYREAEEWILKKLESIIDKHNDDEHYNRLDLITDIEFIYNKLKGKNHE